MTARVEKNAVYKVQPPAGLRGNGLLTFWAEPVLMPPQVGQFLFPFFAFTRQLHPSFFEIGLPCRIVGIGVPLDLGVPDDFHVARQNERHIAAIHDVLAGEGPLWTISALEVFVLDPACGLRWVSSLRPLPQRFPDRMVHEVKRTFRNSIFVTSPPHRPGGRIEVQLKQGEGEKRQRQKGVVGILRLK